MPNDHRSFLCPNNATNRQQHADLDSFKQGGWRVVDAGRDALNSDVLIVTLNGTSGGSLAPNPRLAIAKTKMGKQKVTLDAHPDPVDFRDKLYEPTLIEVPSEWPLERYLKVWGSDKVPILHQREEGACTGFGLAAVAHYLLRRRKVHPDRMRVSPRMFYEMARRYDEWEREDYSGSSARGAMKGWHKHGVCTEREWPYVPQSSQGGLTPARAQFALRRPLGAYLRVNHRDLVAMHSALAEVGILYATAILHDGWGTVGTQGKIRQSSAITGAHTFALVGYDQKGFWLQNSWDSTWGRGGFAHLSYDDWLANGTDVWVARLGAPVVTSGTRRRIFTGSETLLSADVRRAQLQQHTVAIGNDGALRQTGEVGNTAEEVHRLLGQDGDFEKRSKGWAKKRLLLYAHGGLTSEKAALQRVGEYLPALLNNEVYPIAFIWKTDFWSTLTNILKEVVSTRRPEGAFDTAKDFMLDRLDDTLELLAKLPGRLAWEEMKENAVLATERPDGGARQLLADLLGLCERNPKVEIHFAAHSAGSVFLGPFLRRFCEAGQKVVSLNLWAPACSMDFFRANYLEALRAGHVARFGLHTLKDPAERDDNCANIYHKSLLYLVANSFESRLGTQFGEGMPILGMEKFILEEKALFGVSANKVRKENPHAIKLSCGPDAWWIRSPNNLEPGDAFASLSRRHGDFDDDKATVQSTLVRILGKTGAASSTTAGQVEFRPTSSGLRACRQNLEKAVLGNR